MHKYSHDKAYQAFRILQLTFIIAPILAGLDKFFYLMADWSGYLAPAISKMLNHHDQAFMMLVGAVEIVAGIGVIFKPKVFAYIVCAWLLCIILNLLLLGDYFDIALRDLGLCLAAFSLGRLSQKYT